MENEEKTSIMRTILKIAIGIGVGKVVDDIITALLPTQVALPVKIVHKIGAYSLSWVVSDWVTDKIEEQVDSAKAQIAEMAEKIALAQKELEEKEKEEAV